MNFLLVVPVKPRFSFLFLQQAGEEQSGETSFPR